MKFCAVLLLSIASCTPDRAALVIESQSPALQGHQLVEPVGIEALGGVFTPILEPGCRMPCEVTSVFSTAEDNQTEILIHLSRGIKKVARENHPLGTIAIMDIPHLPRGQPQIAVTLKAIGGNILLFARDSSRSPLRLERRAA
jgi:molecular chaperone DnaK (HSP70)